MRQSPAPLGTVFVVGLAAMSAATAPVLAQDPWLVPDRPTISPNEMVAVSLCNGETFPISEEPTAEDDLSEWVIIDDDGRRPIGTTVADEMELVSNPHFSNAGLYVLATAYKPWYREKSPDAFERYLQQEEGANVYSLRVREGLTRGEPGREFCHKYAKLFLRVGDASDAAAQKPVGHRFELVPLSDPAEWQAGDTVSFKLLLDGAPVAGHRVCSNYQGRGAFNWASQGRSNNTGTVSFNFGRPGIWYLRTHLIRPLDKSKELSDPAAQKADWESFYATITFHVNPRSASGAGG